MHMHPRTINDGHGSRMTFLRVTYDAETGTEVLHLTGTVDPGAGPPEHVHRIQREAVTVRAGRIGYVVDGGSEQFGGPGDRVVFEPGVRHRFWNAGDDELILDGEVTPPDNFEWFLTHVYDSIAANGGRPGAFDSAYLLTRYSSEFTMTAVPPSVRRVVFPLQAFAGRLLNRYGHFADAPTPIHRPLGATLPGRSTTRARSSAG
jgi:quercetin dioxygenase-like cupin family protein